MDSAMEKVLSNDALYPDAMESAVNWTLHEYDRLSLQEITQMWTKKKREQKFLCKALVVAVHGEKLTIDDCLSTALTKDEYSELERCDPMMLGSLYIVSKDNFENYLKEEGGEITDDCLLSRWFYDAKLDRPGVEIKRLNIIYEKYRKADNVGDRTTAGLAKVLMLAIRIQPKFKFEAPVTTIKDIYDSLRWAQKELSDMPNMGRLQSLSTFENNYWKKNASRKEAIKKLGRGGSHENLLKIIRRR